MCSVRWCIDGLGVFYAGRVSVCLGPRLNWGWGWRRGASSSPPVNYFTDRSRAVLLLWIFLCFFLSCVCYAFVRASVYMCLVVTCWKRADLLALVRGF